VKPQSDYVLFYLRADLTVQQPITKSAPLHEHNDDYGEDFDDDDNDDDDDDNNNNRPHSITLLKNKIKVLLQRATRTLCYWVQKTIFVHVKYLIDNLIVTKQA
jgi:hypothetical protein